MDFQQYQKMFPSPQQLQQQQQNGFSAMNFYPPSPFRHQPHQHNGYQQYPHQQHQPMMAFNNNHPFSPMPKNFGHHNYANHHFMAGNGQQQFQAHHRNNNNFQLPPTFNLPLLASTSSLDSASMTMTNSPQSLTISTDGSVKEETAREIFFRTLSSSLKEANKFYSGKQTTWKNPFLYKTNLCDNYCNRSYCRYGVNCWYAHGSHELRCIPESDELPDPAFISQYLSFLGLPKQTLDQIIQYAYYVANLLTITTTPSSEAPSFTTSKKSSELPSFDLLHSETFSPIKNDEPKLPLTPSNVSDPINIVSKPKNDKFYSSLASNGGWGEIESALNGIVVDENSGIIENGDDEEAEDNFGKSYKLFGDSYNNSPQKHW